MGLKYHNRVRTESTYSGTCIFSAFNLNLSHDAFASLVCSTSSTARKSSSDADPRSRCCNPRRSPDKSPPLFLDRCLREEVSCLCLRAQGPLLQFSPGTFGRSPRGMALEVQSALPPPSTVSCQLETFYSYRYLIKVLLSLPALRLKSVKADFVLFEDTLDN